MRAFAVAYCLGFLILAGTVVFLIFHEEGVQKYRHVPDPIMSRLAGRPILVAEETDAWRVRKAVGAALLVATALMALSAVILWVLLLDRAWRAVQPLRDADPAEAGIPTPGRAVGLLLVPVFNLYWCFVAIAGLARRINKQRRLLFDGGPIVSERMGTAICAWACCSIPLPLMWLLFPVTAVLVYLFSGQLDRGTNEILLGRRPL